MSLDSPLPTQTAFPFHYVRHLDYGIFYTTCCSGKQSDISPFIAYGSNLCESGFCRRHLHSCLYPTSASGHGVLATIFMRYWPTSGRAVALGKKISSASALIICLHIRRLPQNGSTASSLQHSALGYPSHGLMYSQPYINLRQMKRFLCIQLHAGTRQMVLGLALTAQAGC